MSEGGSKKCTHRQYDGLLGFAAGVVAAGVCHAVYKHCSSSGKSSGCCGTKKNKGNKTSCSSSACNCCCCPSFNGSDCCCDTGKCSCSSGCGCSSDSDCGCGAKCGQSSCCGQTSKPQACSKPCNCCCCPSYDGSACCCDTGKCTCSGKCGCTGDNDCGCGAKCSKSSCCSEKSSSSSGASCCGGASKASASCSCKDGDCKCTPSANCGCGGKGCCGSSSCSCKDGDCKCTASANCGCGGKGCCGSSSCSCKGDCKCTASANCGCGGKGCCGSSSCSCKDGDCKCTPAANCGCGGKGCCGSSSCSCKDGDCKCTASANCGCGGKGCCGTTAVTYSLADQPARFKAQQDANDLRALDIDSFFDGSSLQGKHVLVTGGNRGIGLALVKELANNGALVYATSRSPCEEHDAMENVTNICGIEVTSDECMQKLIAALDGVTLDILINNAGYFYGPVENLDSLNFAEESAMIEICAIGSLRVTAALWNANKLRDDGSAKIAMITSQGGSVAWRDVQNAPGPDFGANYGHHMSKAAQNMMSKLVALELKDKALVAVLHPGFNRTGMTSKYKEIWDIEGAVDASVGAKRVLHEINILSAETSGQFINCEDGLQIPW